MFLIRIRAQYGVLFSPLSLSPRTRTIYSPSITVGGWLMPWDSNLGVLPTGHLTHRLLSSVHVEPGRVPAPPPPPPPASVFAAQEVPTIPQKLESITT